MFRLIAIFLVTGVLLFSIVTVRAKSENSNNGKSDVAAANQGKSDEARVNNGSEKAGEKSDVKPSSKPEVSSNPKVNSAQARLRTAKSASGSGQVVVCDPNADWKNHGEYVSCVAKSGAGGEAVSAAARSDVGKKNESSSSATPSVSATVSASLLPSQTASGEAELEILETDSIPVVVEKSLGKVVKSFRSFLKSLFGF